MNSSKDFFLSAIGVTLPNEVMDYDVFIQKDRDKQPSFGIMHKKDGSVILRVNPWDCDGIIVKL